MIERFLAAKRLQGCTDKTLKRYNWTLLHAKQRIGKPLEDVTAQDVRAYIARRIEQDGISKVTANGELMILRTLYTWARDEEIIEKSPMERIKRIKVPKVQKAAFSDDECERLRQACRNAKETAIIEVLLSTGCRVGELVGIKLEDIHDGKAIVHGKGQKDRMVYFTDRALKAVKEYAAQRCDESPYLIRGQGDTSPSSTRSIGHIVSKIGDRATVPHTHPHRFRRTCATRALRAGMPLALVSKMLGHADIKTTQIYLDIRESDLEAAHRRYVT